jgi:hypothetical protein
VLRFRAPASSGLNFCVTQVNSCFKADAAQTRVRFPVCLSALSADGVPLLDCVEEEREASEGPKR